MTFEQLEYFTAVVEQKTFLDAAESLHIAQSTLSKQIIRLEKELGVQLLDRSRRSAALTEAGEFFYADAVNLYAEYRKMRQRIQTYTSAEDVPLRIGTLPILTQYHLTPVFKKFSADHPKIPFTLDEIEETELMNGLTDGKYDFVIAREHMLDSGKYQIYSLAGDTLVAILPTGHPLAKRTSVSLAELSDQKFILMNRYTSIYQLCMKHFATSGIDIHLVRTARVESIFSAVAVGEGISLLANSNLEIFHHPDIAALPLNPPIKLSVVLAKQRTAQSASHSYAQNTLIEFLIQSVSE